MVMKIGKIGPLVPMESFTNYVDKFLASFDNLLYLIKVDIFGLPTHLFL